MTALGLERSLTDYTRGTVLLATSLEYAPEHTREASALLQRMQASDDPVVRQRIWQTALGLVARPHNRTQQRERGYDS